MSKWYVIYTKPRSEKKVAERLVESGYEAYCPVISVMKQWSDRKKKVQVPMFPSYVFIKISDLERKNVLVDRGVINYVFWQGKPAVVQENEITAVKRIAEKGKSILIENNKLLKGETVTIPNGPFKGLEGVVQKSDEKKLSVLIKQLKCVVHFKY